MLQKFRFTLVAILVPVSLSAVLYPVRHPEKTYGLKIITLGDMCTEADAIIIGEVVSETTKIEVDSLVYNIFTIVKVRVFEDLKKAFNKEYCFLRIRRGEATVGEIREALEDATEKGLIDRSDFVWRRFNWDEGKRPDTTKIRQLIAGVPDIPFKDTIFVFLHAWKGDTFTLNEGLGRFTVTDTFVKYYWERHPAIPDAPIKDEKLPISLAKGLVKAALMYPDIVDAKIDTTYEEAKKMFEAKTPITMIRNYVLDRLRKIAKLTEGR